MSQQTFICDEKQLPEIASRLVALMDQCAIFAFTGPLGAGKTTLIRQILQQAEVAQLVTSPTFTYVNGYQNDKQQLFYHFDLYRIETLDAFIAAGFNEYLYAPGSWALIEWPEVIMPLLHGNVARVDLAYADDKRLITITV